MTAVINYINMLCTSVNIFHIIIILNNIKFPKKNYVF